MKRLVLIVALLAAVSWCGAEVVVSGTNVCYMTADGDVWPIASDTFRPQRTIVDIKLTGATASNYYRLRENNVSGKIVWEHVTGETVQEARAEQYHLSVGAGCALYLDSDDRTTDTFKLFLCRDPKEK